jgi:patatin-like phospholipase/acyl hydrolase
MVKIISIDGGGIKGIVAATILNRLEETFQKPLHKCTDIIAGTSTGGLIACGLTIPEEVGDDEFSTGNARFDTKDLVEVYKNLGEIVFTNTFWYRVKTLWGLIGPKYKINGLEKVIEAKFQDIKLEKALTHVIICTYDLCSRQPVIFSSEHPILNKITMKEACMGTSSVPTYFPSVSASIENNKFNLIDGGIFAVNPALCAMAIAKQKQPNAKINVVSIGNGSSNKALKYEDTKDWGLLDWASPMADVILDSIGDAVGFQTKYLAEASGGRYARLQFELPEELRAMDNADPKNLQALQDITNEYLDRNPKEFQLAIDILSK